MKWWILFLFIVSCVSAVASDFTHDSEILMQQLQVQQEQLKVQQEHLKLQAEQVAILKKWDRGADDLARAARNLARAARNLIRDIMHPDNFLWLYFAITSELWNMAGDASEYAIRGYEFFADLFDYAMDISTFHPAAYAYLKQWDRTKDDIRAGAKKFCELRTPYVQNAPFLKNGTERARAEHFVNRLCDLVAEL